jgi:outer membrane immunogenic protein
MGVVAMRGLLVAAVTIGAVSGAHAADMPDFLRGSIPAAPVTRNWDGWYVGGEAGYTSAEADFSRSVVGLTNFIFRDSVLQDPASQFGLLPKTTMQGTGFGAFVGRNYQWDDLVFGLEANYNYMNSLATSTSGSMALLFTNPAGETPPPNHSYTYGITLTGTAAAQIKDVITFRGRAGWATGDFLPYVFGGLAVGRMDVSRTVISAVTKRDDVTVSTTDPFTGVVTTNTIIGTPVPVPSVSKIMREERSNSFVGGWTGGLGGEYMVWNGVFVRAEWEYIKFLAVKNTVVQANNLRAGIGYKF